MFRSHCQNNCGRPRRWVNGTQLCLLSLNVYTLKSLKNLAEVKTRGTRGKGEDLSEDRDKNIQGNDISSKNYHTGVNELVHWSLGFLIFIWIDLFKKKKPAKSPVSYLFCEKVWNLIVSHRQIFLFFSQHFIPVSSFCPELLVYRIALFKSRAFDLSSPSQLTSHLFYYDFHMPLSICI